ncbi:outer membrane beta-barrel protein [Seonamhaeicola aphaedonensis]|uniref:Outer membrane receptor protein involved in Fe transport n=1 Tax=Seonamhaeicola aphaedonensis TaxID=1461338 RepID=A0A3D9HJ82_9FLAO|nr:outer membrane beta-barrel family protein [Seonamhaeicola aphaedonensis]RED49508.1 outer membrane receptor protein involved in Fe transport [Seonamhaeicola aphaedonensis]
MQKRFLALLFFSFSFVCFSQDLVIQGRVQDEKNLPIAFANIVIFNDNVFVSGTTTNDNGYFQIENLNASNFIIKVSFLGYESVETPITVESNTSIEPIILKETVEILEGVTVIAKKPTVKRMVDRIIFNLENSTLSNSNVLDVLKQTPGVMVHDGNITVKNSTPVVYINDRRVHLSVEEVQQLLEGTPAENIKSIEVITNPPARYDAEGGAVLNIITSKNIVTGYHGSVFGNFKQGPEFPKYTYGTSHFFKTKKIDTYLNFSDSPKREFRNNDQFINFFNGTQPATSWETDVKSTVRTADKTISGNINYKLNNKNSLGFSTNMLIAPRESTKDFVNSTTEVFNANKELDSSFVTDGRSVYETFNLAFTLDYNHKFNNRGEQLSASIHHTNYDFSSFQNVDTDYLFPDQSLIRDNRFQTFSSQKIKLYTGQIDYYLPLNDGVEFEAGGKVSDINSESLVTQYIFDNGIREEDLNNSDTFIYNETNFAAYTSYSQDWDSWSIKTGLRLEYTSIEGNSLLNNQMNKTDYLKFFPSIHILNRLNSNNEIYLNYKRRIARPRYNQLNPFRYFLNDNTFVVGDPNLMPQIDDVVTFGYTFNKDFTFEIYYRYENDPAQEIVFQDNEENVLKYSFTNIDNSISYGLDFITYTQLLKRWNLSVVSSLFYYENKFFALESDNSLQSIDRWSLYFQVANFFYFLEDNSLTADITYLFISPVVANGPSVTSTRSGLNINVRKSFWDNKASLSLGIADVFNNLNFNQTTQYANQDVFMKSRMENRLFIVGFNYKFGNTRLNKTRKLIDLEERDRLERIKD